MLGQCVDAWEYNVYACEGKCTKTETPCNGQCKHPGYCKLGNQCVRTHWWVKDDEGKQFKSCNGGCLEKSEKSN